MTESSASSAYSELVEAIVKAVPEINLRDCNDVVYGRRHITLADVVVLLRSEMSYSEIGEFVCKDWDLSKDLSGQESITIGILHDAICKQA